MAASACAIMLRLSLVDMQGASGLAKDTYKFVAVSLTLATVCTSFAQILQVRQALLPCMIAPYPWTYCGHLTYQCACAYMTIVLCRLPC